MDTDISAGPLVRLGFVGGPALPWGPWENILPDILGSVLRRLPCLSDRASLRSVCRAWRDAARIQHPPPPPPLPLLVCQNFSVCSFRFSQETTVFRRISLPDAVAAENVRCMGSFEGWLVGAPRSSQPSYADGEYFLLNPFTQDVVCLPRRCEFHFCNSIPVVNSSASIYCAIYRRGQRMKFNKVILSASPDSGSRCVVAATTSAAFALWRPGMPSWCLCMSGYSGPDDIVFYKGKLYYNHRIYIYCIEFEEDDERMIISHAEQYLIEPLPLFKYFSTIWSCNLVEWRGKLLLVVRYADGYRDLQNIVKVGVFAVDFSTDPPRFIEINSLDGDCLFISSCGSKSFPACQYDVDEGDFVYFINHDLRPDYPQPTTSSSSFNVFVYNMRDASTATFSVDGPEDNFDPSDRSLVWFFPPE